MQRRSYISEYMWQEQADKKVATQSRMKVDKAKYMEVAKKKKNNVRDMTCKGTIDNHLSGDTVLSAKDDGKSEEVKELTRQTKTKKPEAAIGIVKEVTSAKL